MQVFKVFYFFFFYNLWFFWFFLCLILNLKIFILKVAVLLLTFKIGKPEMRAGWILGTGTAWPSPTRCPERVRWSIRHGVRVGCRETDNELGRILILPDDWSIVFGKLRKVIVDIFECENQRARASLLWRAYDQNKLQIYRWFNLNTVEGYTEENI